MKSKHIKTLELPETYFPISATQLLAICKCKHYRVGFDGALNYSKLKDILTDEVGLSSEQVKQCLHP